MVPCVSTFLFPALHSPVAPDGGATVAQCEDCVEFIGNLPGLASTRMYACYSVCQDDDLFPGFTSGAECITCIQDTDYTVQACKDWCAPSAIALMR